MAKGRPVALAAAAVANGRLPASQPATVRNATEPANVVVMFVVVLAKSKRSSRDVQTITLVSHDRQSPLIGIFVSLPERETPNPCARKRSGRLLEQAAR